MNAKLNRQIDQATTKVEKKAKTFKRKAKRSAGKYAVGIGTVLGLVLAMFALNGLNSFYAKYELYFRSPLQNPLVFHEKILPLPTKMPTPTIVPSPSVMPKKAPVKRSLVPVAYAAESVDFDEVFEKQRILESGKGTAPVGHHKTCESKGLWNEIGYGNRQGLCFDTMEEGRLTLEKWYQKRFAEGMTLSEALCYWEGQGKGVSNCEYSRKYFNL